MLQSRFVYILTESWMMDMHGTVPCPTWFQQTETPGKTYREKCSYPFSRKKGIFSVGGTNSRNQEKGVIFFRQESTKLLRRVKFCMYLSPFVCSACLIFYAQIYSSFNTTLEVMKNTTYIGKCFQFETVILTFTKRVLYLTLRKNAFCLKGVFYWASK